MSALGTGITGGEPLERLNRVVEYASALKQAFGKEHHIHLYTGCAPSDTVLQNLTGLVDEIRLHPPVECWDHILETDFIAAVRHARELGFAAGLEVPALPEIGYLEAALPDLDFLNINELEWGETNAAEMRSRSLHPEDSVHNAVLVRGTGLSPSPAMRTSGSVVLPLKIQSSSENGFSGLPGTLPGRSTRLQKMAPWCMDWSRMFGLSRPCSKITGRICILSRTEP